MNRFNSRFSLLGNVNYITNVNPCLESDVPDKNSQLLDLIFTSENGRLPSGDISYFLGEKANPQVREFIKQNLMLERSDGAQGVNLSQSQINAFRKCITDDDIAKFSRNSDESKEEYALRLKSYLHEERFQRYLKKERSKIEMIIDGKS